MAATDKLLSTQPVIIDPAAINTGSTVEPIAVIAESVPTQQVDIDITSTSIQEVPPSEEFVLGVVSPDRKTIEKAIGMLIGGVGFVYELVEDKVVEGRYFLRVISRIGPLQVRQFAEAFQGVSQRIGIYIENTPVTAL